MRGDSQSSIRGAIKGNTKSEAGSGESLCWLWKAETKEESGEWRRRDIVRKKREGTATGREGEREREYIRREPAPVMWRGRGRGRESCEEITKREKILRG